MWHVKVLPFPLLYFKLIDDIRIGLPDAVDPSLGRLDYASLLQQALMEMAIEGITNKM